MSCFPFLTYTHHHAIKGRVFLAPYWPLAFIVIGIFLPSTRPVHAEDPFALPVRKTEPMTAAEQLKKFHLPPGFAIQLVASEPAIGKPMNLAFDAKGRLWLTQSREYPHPAPLDQKGHRDKIMVLENFDANGQAQKITTFAEDLNIPIGLYPYKNGCLAFSIPNVYYFEDTDGDGRADRREIFLSRFGFEKDTHGMTGSFRRGYDGWLYADHGFNNDSTLRAQDGSEIKLNSGNVYRVKIDGSRVEQFTWGQVNPFGLNFDHLGDLWSTDCHSSPVYMLLRGGHYPSFGKPHDGLGFAPDICAHSHGSTAIAGMVFYAATNFPAEFQNNTYIGNVMTCRINRDSFREHGSTRIAQEEPDFLICDDPWFRPVDLQLGPDGAMYVADFYNRIIGHYEVPLDHPGRDRERGRIWRIVYQGEKASRPDRPAEKSSWRPAREEKPAKELITELGDANLTRRLLAMSELTDRVGPSAIQPLQSMLKNKKSSSAQKIHGLWTLQRLDALAEKFLEAAAQDKDRDVRVHALRVIGENVKLTSVQHHLLITALHDSDAYVQRAAADALGRHPAFANIQPLLELRRRISPQDTQLIHVVKMALRDQLAAGNNFARQLPMNLSEEHSRAIAEVSLAVKSAEAGLFVLRHVQLFPESRPRLSDYLRHAARYTPELQMGELVSFVKAKFAHDLDFQLTLFKAVQEGTQQRGAVLAEPVRVWGESLAEALLTSVDPNALDWHHSPVAKETSANPWFLEKRPSADGNKEAPFISSLPGGEKLTGILTSKPFTLPEKISFFIAGHDGPPDQPPQKKNFVRLRDAATQKILAEQPAPRHDHAQAVIWALPEHAGKRAFWELVDGDSGGAYAWLAVGRFEPPLVALPKIMPNQVDQRQMAGAEMAESLRLSKLEARLGEILQNGKLSLEPRAAAAQALATLNPSTHTPVLAGLLANTDEPMKLREKSAQALSQINSSQAHAALLETLRTAPQRLLTPVALALASHAEGAEALLQTVEQGKLSAHVLQENSVKDRLLAAKPKDAAARWEVLTRNLAPISAEKQKVIDARRAAYQPAIASAERGLAVFTQACAICHQIDGQGAVVGPQLDGVGQRGVDRLLEDILDPNRNVDHAFRYSNVTLKDDQVISGLFRREEGELLVLVDGTGREISVPKKEVAERRESENSLMPENFSELITEKDFYDLIAYLMSKGAKSEAEK